LGADRFGFSQPEVRLRVYAYSMLYKRYGLSEDEIAFIESQVAEHNDAIPDDVAVEETADD
jgi:hypothetical protein